MRLPGSEQQWSFCLILGSLKLAVGVVVFGLWGCMHAGIAVPVGMTGSQVRGDSFIHQVYRNDNRGGPLLHVYLEGDGRPWASLTRVARDPTPKRALMLELMAMDSAAAVYVGRPCYFFVVETKCGPEWWTDKRYSAAVVSSLNRVIDTYAADFSGVVLMGHSGGGSLAMLLAARRDDLVGVVTLAGNLDTDRWTQHHDYSPLKGSLNPAADPPLPATILQLHYLGERDTVITKAMVSANIERQPRADLVMLEKVDHNCCWVQLWPDLLQDLQARLAVP